MWWKIALGIVALILLSPFVFMWLYVRTFDLRYGSPEHLRALAMSTWGTPPEESETPRTR